MPVSATLRPSGQSRRPSKSSGRPSGSSWVLMKPVWSPASNGTHSRSARSNDSSSVRSVPDSFVGTPIEDRMPHEWSRIACQPSMVSSWPIARPRPVARQTVV